MVIGVASMTSKNFIAPWILRTSKCRSDSRRTLRRRTQAMIQRMTSSRRRGGGASTGYRRVPCSYLSPFINYALQDPSLRYLSMANEGDAVALIAELHSRAPAALPYGRGISMMQNSGLGNAVSPLTSLTWTFRLPQLLIVTWRGQPGCS